MSPSATPGPAKDLGTEPGSWSAAQRELEEILARLDSDEVDVDHLAAEVERAAFLIKWCRERISAARLSIDSAVASLESPAAGSTESRSASAAPTVAAALPPSDDSSLFDDEPF